MNILKEHMSYILLKSQETGISPDVLETVWADCENKQKIDNPELPQIDPAFTSKVMSKFDDKVNMMNVEKARSMIMAREEAKRVGQKWIDSLAQNNYVQAKEEFPKFVKSAFESIVNSKSKEFIEKFSDKLRKNSSGT